MKVTFKDLAQQKFTIEFEPTELISKVKERLSEEKGWEPKDQKLIYSGKILKDDQTLETYNIEEKGYVVCMVTKKPKPAAASSSAPPATPAQATTSSTPAAPPAPAAQPPPTQSAAPSTPTPSSRNAADPSALTMGSQRAEAISNMEAMGFPRDDIEAAMRAAFFNPDRAVEYLLNGIPESVQQEQRAARQAAPPAAAAAAAAASAPPAQAQQPAAGSTPATGGDDGGNVNLFDLAAQQRGGSGGGAPRESTSSAAAAAAAAAAAGQAGGLGNLDFLRNNAQFQQLRQVVQQQPQMLEPILQQLGAGNPQLAQLIATNPEQFLELLGEEADDDVPLPPGAQAIAVTEEERDAIERLCRLGFDRDQAIQAYFACDKNEEMAANFLFDQPDDDDAPQN